MLAVTLSVVTAVIIVIIIAIVAACLFYRRKQTKNQNDDPHHEDPEKISPKSDDDDDNDEMKYIRLNEFEDRLLLSGGRMVTTITWYRGDHTIAAQHIQQRLDRIIQVNPWLLGKVQHRKRWYPFGANYLVYPKSVLSSISTKNERPSDDLFHHISSSESPLSRYDTSMEDVSDIVRQHNQLSCLPDYHHSVYRVVIIPCAKSPTTHFAILISMSHIVGDAHTYYALYHALLNNNDTCTEDALPVVSTDITVGIDSSSNKETIVSTSDLDPAIPILTVQRVSEYSHDVQYAMGGSRRDATLSVSFSLIIPSALSMIYGKIRNLCSSSNRYQIQRRYIRIDHDKISILKREAISSTPPLDGDKSNNKPPTFCSLNDVVTAWLMMNSKCQHGFMAINMRNRKLHQRNTDNCITHTTLNNAGTTTNTSPAGNNNNNIIEMYPDSLAGNYISLVYYQIPKNCRSPLLIRQSLSNLRRVEDEESPSLSTKTHRNQPFKTKTATATSTTTKAPTPAPLLLFGGSIVVTNWCSFHNSAVSNTSSPIINVDASSALITTSDGDKKQIDSSMTTKLSSKFIMHEELHYPLYTYQVDTHPYNTIIAILYQETTNQIGLMLCGSPFKLDTLIQSCPFAGSSSAA